MSRMRYGLAPILVCLLLVASLGVVHGVYSDRWGQSGQLEQALAGLPRVPAKFGDWVGEDVPYDAEDMVRAGIRGSVYRRFKNVRTGELVSVLLVCGRGGPISVHTPDVCYAGAGYRLMGTAQQREIETSDGHKAAFSSARFGKATGVVPSHLEIYWTWSRDGVLWQAPENPRLSLARAPALFKLYVVSEVSMNERSATRDSCDRFLRQALPTIRQSLPPAD